MEEMSILSKDQRENMINEHLQQIDNGNLDAIINLANYYYYYEKDYSSAIKYYQLGIENKLEDCYLQLGKYYKIKKNHDMAFEIWNNGIDEIKSTKCMLKIAFYYKNNQMYDKAIKYYTMCFEHGNVVGMRQLGLFYQYIKDYDQMKKCLIKAIQYGDYNSAHYLGLYYKEIFNYDVMKKYFLIAVENDHNVAIYDLAYHYESIEGNIKMAIKYYTKGEEIEDENCIDALKKFNLI